jgi:hypothetical protein
VLNIFDSNVTYFLIIILLWNLKGERAGFHLLYLQVINAIAYTDLKFLCEQPRPYDLVPALKVLGTSGYGFPSGAASAIVTSFGFIFFILKPARTQYKIFASIMIFLVGLTRVYLGAHFPSDIIGGYGVGLATLTGYYYLVDYVEKWLHSYPKRDQLFFHMVLIGFLGIIHVSHDALLLPLLLGAIIAHLFYKHAKKINVKDASITIYLPIILSLCGTAVLYYAAQAMVDHSSSSIIMHIFQYLIMIVLGMWISQSSYVFDWLVKKI